MSRDQSIGQSHGQTENYLVVAPTERLENSIGRLRLRGSYRATDAGIFTIAAFSLSSAFFAHLVIDMEK
jgi:hypothetical protein